MLIDAKRVGGGILYGKSMNVWSLRKCSRKHLLYILFGNWVAIRLVQRFEPPQNAIIFLDASNGRNFLLRWYRCKQGKITFMCTHDDFPYRISLLGKKGKSNRSLHFALQVQQQPAASNEKDVCSSSETFLANAKKRNLVYVPFPHLN